MYSAPTDPRRRRSLAGDDHPAHTHTANTLSLSRKTHSGRPLIIHHCPTMPNQSTALSSRKKQKTRYHRQSPTKTPVPAATAARTATILSSDLLPAAPATTAP
ncbi:hypothetical protein PGTUg99_003204 [Puccinia graminis f. sp. tritici]|uniref:Uncharacterized protein n=1 Tax=Puccinia graminis f. sp. tritici TaxID=56615 RepID=A0A5B0N8R6_PUCGR|nr:hypothetical protein PGTUg99_003204 [Puccinia graminis f. sp. tritici]